MTHIRPLSHRRRTKAERSTPIATTDLAGWLTVASVLLAGLVWAYWPVVVQLVKDWQRDPNYSVGQLVPLAALYLVWQERWALRRGTVRPCWWGLAVIAVAQIGRGYGMLMLFESAERYSLILSIAGLILLVGGKQVFWRLRWALLFLVLMVPLPGRVHNLISGPLQHQATSGAVFLLELAGVTVWREGNVIVLNGSVHVAVAEACSGLRMLTAFVVVAAVLAYIVNRPRWQKVTVLISSIPVAILCNLIRLFVTTELYLWADDKTAEAFFHDFAGLTMMPLAIGLLVGELWVLNTLVLPDDPAAGKVREGGVK